MDKDEEKFREEHGDELAERILLRTSQMYDYPFWMKEITACWDDADIAYQVALSDG